MVGVAVGFLGGGVLVGVSTGAVVGVGGTGVAVAVGGAGVAVAVGMGGGGGGVVTAAKVCKTGERIVPPTVSRPIVRGSARATMRRLFMQDSLR
jgi:hypothetical protein